MSMPEEINRIVTDSPTDVFYTPSLSANENLRHAGVPDWPQSQIPEKWDGQTAARIAAHLKEIASGR